MRQISVIIPAYNAEKYLNNCMESILGQICCVLEIILVDDGSTDNTGQIIDQYAEKFEQVVAIHMQNSGPAAARRMGVECATGEYVMFVDSDDWLDKEILEFAGAVAEDTEADIVCMGHKEVDENGHVKVISSQDSGRLELRTTTQMMHHLHGSRFIDSGPWAKLIRRRLFENIDFCENVTIGEDYFMVLQLLEKAERVVLCKEAMYNRCIRITGISRSGYSERHRQAFEEYMRWRHYLLKRYPELNSEIISYHTEYEMAVITAMCRNKEYDKTVIRSLADDLRENRKIVLQCQKTPLYMRISAILIAYCHPLFILIFRSIHLLTGR